MPRGRPRNNPTQGDEMAKEVEKVKVLKKDESVAPLDEVNPVKDACPWCNYSNDDDVKGPIHEKESSLLRNRGHKYQCDTCGKFWDKADFNKPWTEGLERGPAWEREMKLRGLREL